MVTNEGLRAVIYTRVSRDDTGEGASNQRQEEDCRKLVELRRWQLVEVCADISISAATRARRRPQWDRVMELVNTKRVDVIVVWSMDRATRDVRELLDLMDVCEALGVTVATVSGDLDLSTTAGRMMATILGAVARQEIEQKGDRQRRANRQRAAAGEVWSSGFRAFGYEQNGTIRESEAELIRQATHDVLGGASIRSVVRKWTDLGLSSPRNADSGWTHRSVRAILLNPRNAGFVRYRGQVIGKGKWEPIISEHEHVELTALLTNPERLSRKNGSRGRTAENLLSGIARCSTCGETVNAASGYKGAPVYQCGGYHVSTPRAEADALVVSAFLAAAGLTSPGDLLTIPKAGAPTELWSESERLRERQAELGRSFARGAITVEQLEAATAALTEQLAEVERLIGEASEPGATPYEARAEAVRSFGSASLEQQRAVLREVATVTLYPRGRGRRNVPMRHQISVYLTTTDGRTFTAVDDVPSDRKPTEPSTESVGSVTSRDVTPRKPARARKRATAAS